MSLPEREGDAGEEVITSNPTETTTTQAAQTELTEEFTQAVCDSISALFAQAETAENERTVPTVEISIGKFITDHLPRLMRSTREHRNKIFRKGVTSSNSRSNGRENSRT